VEWKMKLIEDYSKLITKSEYQKQYLLQVVSECRRWYPNCKKPPFPRSLK
jgi:hypothetical protein